MKKTGMALLAALWLAVSGCGDGATSDGGSDVGAQSDGPAATVDATTPPDFAVGGDLSVPQDMVFVPCKANTDCLGAKVCEADAGACVECLMDGDCKDAARPRCDPASRACVPCLPPNDNCPLGKFCARSNGTWSCSDGCKLDNECRGAVGGLCCGNKCVDSNSSNDHCGACGRACQVGQACCTAACADTTTDPINCGGCGMRCNPPSARPGCANSKCTIASCVQGYMDCDNQAADGCEINVTNNVNNCGVCNMACNVPNGVPGCSSSMCTIASCLQGYMDCDNQVANGCEINITNNVNNCGGCNMACNVPFGVPGCANSTCTIVSCRQGFKDCRGGAADGCETNVTNDVMNCGACAKSCVVANGTAGCANSVCTIASCNNGFKDCRNGAADGCEANVDNDPNNCGACGMVCASGVCGAGKCVYAPAGVQTAVPVAAVTGSGWTQCYLDTYNTVLPFAQITGTSCTKAKLMMACRATGAATLDVLAWAPRADVLTPIGAAANNTTTHTANGVGWYSDAAWSWGFAPAGDAITHFTCDTVTNVDTGSRVCWDTTGGAGGYRCGVNRTLNNSASYERLVYQAD